MKGLQLIGLLVFLATGPAHAEKNIGLTLERTYLENSFSKGLRPATALAILRATFVSPADHRYLERFKAEASAAQPPVAMKSFTRTPRGYDVVAPSGRHYTLELAKTEVTINGMAVDSSAGAETYVTSVEAALKKSYVSNFWREVAVWPRAYADGLRSIVATVAAQAASVLNLDLDYVRAVPLHTSTTPLDGYYVRLTRVCEEEMAAQAPFDESRTRQIHEGLRAQSALPAEDLSLTDCASLVRKTIAPKFAAPGGLNKISVTEAEGACRHAKTMNGCVAKYRAQMNGGMIQPAGYTNDAAAPAGK